MSTQTPPSPTNATAREGAVDDTIATPGASPSATPSGSPNSNQDPNPNQDTPTPTPTPTSISDPDQTPLTLNGLVSAMFPDVEGAEREKHWNATRVLAQKGAIVAVEDVKGSGRHRRYDPICVRIARALLLLKYNYRLHTNVLVDMGQYLWECKEMLEGCPDVVLTYGEFYQDDTDTWEMNYVLTSSEEAPNLIYPAVDSGPSMGVRHCVSVSIDYA